MDLQGRWLPLAVNVLLQMSRVTITYDLDLLQSRSNGREVIVVQNEAGCSDVLFQSIQLGRTRYGHYPGLLRQQPSQSNLGSCCAFTLGDLTQQLYQLRIGLAVLFGKARHYVAKVVVRELGVSINGSAQEAFAQRTEGNETDSEFFK